MITISYNYSTNDFCFLERILNEASYISDDILISYYTNFFDGSPENSNLIEETHKLCKGRAKLAEIEYNPNLKNNFINLQQYYRYLHNYGRIANYRRSKYDYILFLDGDEIINGKEMKKWLENIDYKKYNSCVFSCYWYFRNFRYQATTYECAGTLVNKNIISENILLDQRERGALNIQPHVTSVLGFDNKPMVHHYSWAKNENENKCKDMLLKKVSCWGHIGDKKWDELIKEEFSRPFNGTDFVHGYKYNIL